MRKIVTILAVLLLASPAMAAVSITVTDNDDCTATISYSDDGDPNGYVRAFALDITVDGGAVITAVDAAMAGDCNATDQGYGIFPGSFAREIDAAAPDWGDPCYSPVGYVDDLPGDTQGGIGTSGVTVEMGSLYEDGNSPPSSGTLCTVTVDIGCNMTVAVNAGRGGVVLEDASTVTPDLSGAQGVAIADCGGCDCYGDANGDGTTVNVSDLATIVGVLGGYAGTTPPYTIDPLLAGQECWDVNGDGKINVSDLATIVGFLGGYAGTTPPYTGPCMPAP